VQLLARIRQLLMGAAVVVILLLAMPTLYSKLHYERSGGPPVSTSEFYAKIISGADSSKVSEDGTQMGRITQIVFWWDRHSASAQPKEFFLGHGVASTEITRLYSGDVGRRYYPLQVSNTTGVLLLWDVGVTGFLIAVMAITFASLHSLRLSERAEIPEFHRAALEAGAVILAMLLTALFYKHFGLRSAAVQFVLYLSVGQACYWSARLARAKRREHVQALRGIRLRPGAAA
jgi:hypothetical protein